MYYEARPYDEIDARNVARNVARNGVRNVATNGANGGHENVASADHDEDEYDVTLFDNSIYGVGNDGRQQNVENVYYSEVM